MKRVTISCLTCVLIALCCNHALAQTPVLDRNNNPSTCHGSEGSITFSGLTPNASYLVTYADDGFTRGPVAVTSNASGQLVLTGLNAGLYSNFAFNDGATIKELWTGVVLSNPILVPTFNPVPPICAGNPAPVLPTTSTNGFSGVWTPAINNQVSGIYTFIPTPNTCALTVNLAVTVTPRTVPIFSFGTQQLHCGPGPASVPALTNMSLNGIVGYWTPTIVDPNRSGTYVFTPTTSGCIAGTSYTLIINPIITPTFDFGTSLSVCTGDAVPELPLTSNNGITGIWYPDKVNNTTSGIYRFQPLSDPCAPQVTFRVTVNPIIQPTFSFGNALTICAGESVPALPATSDNGITGTWSPAVVDNTTSGTYTFTSTSDPCAPPATFSVTVNPVHTPAFSFGNALTVCTGEAVPGLPTVSDNGITGTWSPAMVDNTTSGIYTFTSTSDPCAPPVNFTVTVKPIIPPVFSFGNAVTICSGATAPVLPAVSVNGITGAWSPAVIDNTASGTYTFTSTTDPCAPPATLTVTVNPVVTPGFDFGNALSVCINTTPPVLPGVSNNNVTGTWSPATVDNQRTGAYTFTPAAGQCANPFVLSYEVNSIPSVTATVKDTMVFDGALVPAFDFMVTPSGSSLAWVNNNTAIGLAASGNNPMPAFQATNITNANIAGTITARPYINGCSGSTRSYTITVKPLDKDIFVPNVFSPNGDGNNDQLFVYGNYISTVELHIFNQWGQQVTTLHGKKQGWDGRYKGTPQPVGVYVYVLKAELTDGTRITRKGSITLIR